VLKPSRLSSELVDGDWEKDGGWELSRDWKVAKVKQRSFAEYSMGENVCRVAGGEKRRGGNVGCFINRGKSARPGHPLRRGC